METPRHERRPKRRSTPSEEALRERLQAGETECFFEIYQAYRTRVRRFVASRLRDAHEAEDVTQETFIQAFRSRRSFEGRSSILTWLLGIARFVCLRWQRSARRWLTGADSVGYEVDPAFDARTESRIDALRSLDRCEELLHERRSDADRQIFRLRYLDRLPVRAIARQVDKSPNAVKASLSRTRRALGEGLEAHGLAA